MIQNPVDSASWFRSFSLDERIQSVKALPPEAIRIPEGDSAYGQHRLNRWVEEGAFKNEDSFARFLEILGISRETLLSLLSESSDQLQQRMGEPLPWVHDLHRAYYRTEAKRFESEPIPTLPPGEELYLFSNILKPLIYFYAEHLQAAIQKLQVAYPHIPLNVSHFINLLLQSEHHGLNNILYRTVVLELNVARMQGALRGGTQAERFQHFLERLRDPAVVMQLFEEYPALARQIALYIQQWAAAGIEFLERLCADWQEIRDRLNHGDDLGSIVNLDLNQGDRHHDGRAVIIVEFSCRLKVVYKPRTIAADAHFQELLMWLNQHGVPLEFRILNILTRPDYGWIEFVTPTGCKSSEEIHRFYQRHGAYLALLHVLEATDFHHENLLAEGEHPVLIDLEALFHPPLTQYLPDPLDPQPLKAIEESILHVGLMPQPISSANGIQALNANGLSSALKRVTPHSFPTWENSGTDEMRIVRKHIEVEATDHNLPSLENASIDVLEYRADILTGFTGMYRLIVQHKDELLAENGPLARFAHDPMRIILRGTQLYARLLQESYHPDFLRDCLDRDRLFSRLWHKAMTDPRFRQVAAAEIHDLHQNDIPLFTTRPNARHIWTSRGEQITDFFAESCMDRVHRRITHLSEQDLALQTWFINASMMALVNNPGSFAPHGRAVESNVEYAPEAYLQAARQIGDRLETLALTTQEGAMWLTVNFNDMYLAGISGTVLNLYDGLSGISLFLAYLGHMTGEERYTRLAKQSINTMRRHIAARPSDIVSVGGYSGWGSIIYTLVHLAALWHDPQFVHEAEAIVAFLPDLIRQDTHFDLIAGTSGCLAALLVLYGVHASPETLKAAVLCGNHLLAHARSLETGMAWQTIQGHEACLTGFSHGTAGIAWALLKLAAVTGDTRYEEVAQAAIRYERSQFLPVQGNWRNLLNPQGLPEDQVALAMVQWCHGAPGIGLARLSLLDDAQAREEIEVAVKTTLSEGFGHGDCLCHGDLGNLDLILQASIRLNDSGLREKTYTLANQMVERIRQQGWYCGVPMGIEVPGLMTGIAGIGYGLLRLASPEEIPSVLTLDAPLRGLVD